MPTMVNRTLLMPVLVVLLSMFLLSVKGVNAAIIDDLYDAKIAVADQSQVSQKSAFSLALKQVLIKVRGNQDILGSQQITKSVNQATRFVRSYSYDIEQQQLYLKINFDSEKIEDLIRNAGFPVWDKRRPETIVWLAIQPSYQSDKKIMTQTEFASIYQSLQQRALERGIRLVFPIWDLGDIQNLSVYDIWGAFSHRLSNASERYAVRSIISARIYQSEPTDTKALSTWLADWTMIDSGQVLSNQVQGLDVIQTAQALIDGLADNLAQKYAIDLGDKGRLEVTSEIVVNDIDSLESYTQALALLSNLSVVNRVTLIKQQGPKATFELSLLGGIDDLRNALNLDSRINPVVDDFGQPLGNLEFFWVK